MSISREGDYEILTFDDTGSINVRYTRTVNCVFLRKIPTLSNSYELTTNFSGFSKKKVTKNEGLRIAKELLLKRYLELKGRVLV